MASTSLGFENANLKTSPPDAGLAARKLDIACIPGFHCIYMDLPLLSVMKVVVNLRALQESSKM